MRKTVIALAMCVTLAFSSKSAAFAVSQTTTPASAADVQKSYVEGEALAIVKGDIQLKGPGKVERIAQVSSLALQDVLEEWDDSEVLTKESRRQFEEDETFAIWSVSDRNQTTEEILRELRTDPDVIAAEPNYISRGSGDGRTGSRQHRKYSKQGRPLPHAVVKRHPGLRITGNLYHPSLTDRRIHYGGARLAGRAEEPECPCKRGRHDLCYGYRR